MQLDFFITIVRRVMHGCPQFLDMICSARMVNLSGYPDDQPADRMIYNGGTQQKKFSETPNYITPNPDSE